MSIFNEFKRTIFIFCSRHCSATRKVIRVNCQRWSCVGGGDGGAFGGGMIVCSILLREQLIQQLGGNPAVAHRGRQVCQQKISVCCYFECRLDDLMKPRLDHLVKGQSSWFKCLLSSLKYSSLTTRGRCSPTFLFNLFFVLTFFFLSRRKDFCSTNT